MNRIQELTPCQLQQWMQPSDRIRLVEFYASWCIYHLLTLRKLQKLSSTLCDDTSVGRIDCLGNESLFTACGVIQIPTIGYFCGDIQLLWVGDTDLEVMLKDIQNSARKEHAR